MSAPSNEDPKARYRKYVLSAVMLAMIAYFGGQWVVDRLIQGPVDAERRVTTRLKEDISKREEGLAKIREAAKLLDVWETQSLPSDTEVARSLYQAWLVELIDDVGLANPSVTSSEPVARRGVYYSLTFSVRGRGTLEQLTEFLFAVYQTDLLHQIRSLTISPLQRVEQLDVSLSIEALALIGTGSGDDAATVFEEFRRRTWRTSDRLAYGDLEDYLTIVDRNLFGMGGSPHASDFTVLTSINQVDGEPELWFTIQSTDELVKRRVGETLRVGSLDLKVVETFGTDAVLEMDGERWLLSLGENITDAYALPPEF